MSLLISISFQRLNQLHTKQKQEQTIKPSKFFSFAHITKVIAAAAGSGGGKNYFACLQAQESQLRLSRWRWEFYPSAACRLNFRTKWQLGRPEFQLLLCRAKLIHAAAASSRGERDAIFQDCSEPYLIDEAVIRPNCGAGDDE